MIRQRSTQNVNVLALILGGAALLLPQVSPYLNLFLIVAIFAAVLGYLWPEGVWQWGLWLSFPLLVLSGVNFSQAPNIDTLGYNVLQLAGVLICAYLGCLAGARFSPRRLPWGGVR